MTSLRRAFDLQEDMEVSLEANPGTLSPGYLQGLRKLGFNRLSLGMQSANPEELRLLGRIHNFEDVIQAVCWARQAGFDHLNLDLILGLPDQPMGSWRRSLERALDLRTEHLSLYALTVEEGTPLNHWVSQGLLSQPDPDLAADMYEWATARLEQEGYVQYEISNWARRNRAGELLSCRHNLQYWRNLPYLGFGAGAHGFVDNIRLANKNHPADYIRSCLAGGIHLYPNTAATESAQRIDLQTEIGETMMLGLRLTQEGVSKAGFRERFGRSLEDCYGDEIEDLLRSGLVEWAGERQERLRLSSAGRLLGNQVFMRFI
jgi:oxygen-independent coproporphyrinogen-3 oxidase